MVVLTLNKEYKWKNKSLNKVNNLDPITDFFRIFHYTQKQSLEAFRKKGVLKTYNFIKKETPTQVLSCKFGKIFKNSYSEEHLRWLLLYTTEVTSTPVNIYHDLENRV